jgi:hypothetical protein
MEINLICGTRNFLIDKSVKDFRIDDFIISTDLNLLSKLFRTPDFMSSFGTTAFPILERFTFFLLIGDRDYYLSNPDAPTEGRLSGKKLEILQLFIFCLWFVRDNCANTDILYTYVPGEKIDFSLFNTVLFSTATGEFIDEIFTIEDLEKAKAIYYKICELSSTEVMRENIDFKVKDIDNKIIPGDYNFILYNSQNPIDRAILFLMLARSQSYLPLKILFYIGIYESLFSIDSVEVKYKVAERATFYIGGDFDLKYRNFNIINSAYDIRSKFVHGQLLNKNIKTKDNLIGLCEQVDSLTRVMLLKIISKDSNIFLQEEKELKYWFNQLILK